MVSFLWWPCGTSWLRELQREMQTHGAVRLWSPWYLAHQSRVHTPAETRGGEENEPTMGVQRGREGRSPAPLNAPRPPASPHSHSVLPGVDERWTEREMGEGQREREREKERETQKGLHCFPSGTVDYLLSSTLSGLANLPTVLWVDLWLFLLPGWGRTHPLFGVAITQDITPDCLTSNIRDRTDHGINMEQLSFFCGFFYSGRSSIKTKVSSF